MKCTTLQFPSPGKMKEFKKITNTSLFYINDSELIIKGLIEENDVQLACYTFQATIIDNSKVDGI
ncbi:MAG TPA: hypothetical protein VGO09_00325 [Flavisolibacter sp.]|jgi:hypothetical protein|nr:hypothetical protein [Flavisolibacter sp.]